jgi:hypothetical protein
MALLSSVKAKLWAGIGLLVAGLLFLVRVLTAKNSALRHKVERAEAEIHHRKVVAKKDAEIDEHEDQTIAEIRKPDSTVSDDPNDWIWSDSRVRDETDSRHD